MIKSKYILTLLAMLLCMVARGQDFNPDSPPEPGARYKLTLKANPAEAATVSGGGFYVVNANVNVKAVAKGSNWRFKNWTNAEGEEVSTSSSFTHRKANSAETLTANFEEVKTSRLTIAYDPSLIGESKTYESAVGTAFSTTVSAFTNYVFEKWTNSKGEVVSTNRKVEYTTTEDDETLTAHYRFDPSSPAEPNETKPKHKVYFRCVPDKVSSFSQSNGFSVSEGTKFSFYVYDASNYNFKGWTYEGSDEIICTTRTYEGTMGNNDMRLVAHFEFNPGSPNEPSTDTKQRHTLYATTTALYQGESTLIPIYLENTGNVATLSFKLHLPQNVKANTNAIETTVRTSAYTVEASQEDSVLTVALTGGTQISEHGGVVVRIPVITQEGFKDGEYPVRFSDIAGTNTANTAITFTHRSGRLVVSTLEEGDLQAKFSVDRYMNRAQFTNLSTESARSFEWEFGDGATSTERNPMHQYAEPGTYTVRLTARGLVKTVTAEQNIIINPASTWTASGDYTLDPTAKGARAFSSMHEMFELLSQCTPDGIINIKTGPQATFVTHLTEADSLALVTTMTQKLKAASLTMAFKHEGETPSKLQFVANAATSDLQKVVDYFRHIRLDNVVVTLNDATINIGEIDRYSEQTICSGNATQPEAFTSISGNDAVKVKWTASVAEGCAVTGFTLSGTGDLPAMTLFNDGNAKDLVTYHVDVELNGQVMHSYLYKVYVKPLLKSVTLNSPSDKVELEYGQLTLSCYNLGALAEGYTFHYRRTDTEAGDAAEWTDVRTTSPSIQLTPAEGASYEWYVTAHGECGEAVESAHRTFSIRKRSDLTVESVTAPVEVKANTTFEISAVIRNIGMETTRNTTWMDVLLKVKADGSATVVQNQRHNGALAPSESYTVTFNVQSADATAEPVSYVVATDWYSEEKESNEGNNQKGTELIAIIDRYIDADDYACLKALYQATNGGAWTKTWRVGSNAVSTTGWPGVTFDEAGHVLAIDLHSNNLAGNLPTEGVAFKSLKSLNLSSNSLKGDVAAFSKQMPTLETLNMSNNLLEELKECLPTHITTLNLGYQCNARSLATFKLQNWTMGDKNAPVELGTLIAYDHKNQNFDAHPTLRLYTANNNSYVGEMRYVDGAYRYYLSGLYNYESETEFCVQPSEGPAAYTRLRAKLAWKKGDVNADASVDVLDAQQTLNYILGTYSGNFNFKAADTYSSNNINVQDVVATINLFIGYESAEAKSYTMAHSAWAEKADAMAAKANTLSVEDGALWLDATDRVAALDITLRGVSANDVKLTLNKMRYQLVTHNTANGVRVVIISTTGDMLTGRSKLLRLAKTAIVEQVMAADIDAQPVGVAFDGQATHIEGIEAEGNSRDAIYTLDGRKVNRVGANGVYIVNGKKKAIQRHQ